MLRLSTLVSLLIAAAMSAAASAQPGGASCDSPASAKGDTVAELRDVQGNVLVSDAAGMTSGVDKQRLKNAVRVTTTARAGTLVAFDCGCEVRLKENERLDVELPKACPALVAAVQAVPVGVALGAVPAVGGISTTTGALIATTVGVGAYLLYRNNRNVSPN